MLSLLIIPRDFFSKIMYTIPKLTDKFTGKEALYVNSGRYARTSAFSRLVSDFPSTLNAACPAAREVICHRRAMLYEKDLSFMFMCNHTYRL